MARGVESAEPASNNGRWPKGLLPPRNTWIKNPEIHKIRTPTDERGLIDVPQLIEDVKGTVSANYEWDSRSDCHHLYWPGSKYPFSAENDGLTKPPAFRELPIHKTMLSREFHNWLHRITLPPDMPSKNVMEEVTEEFWEENGDMFYDARDALFLQHIYLQQRTKRLGNIAANITEPGRQKYEEITSQNLEEIEQQRLIRLLNVQQRLGELAIIPNQFELNVDEEDDRAVEVKTLQLGKIVAPDALNLIFNKRGALLREDDAA